MDGARAAWSRVCLPRAGADPIWSELKSASGPRTSRAGDAQKSGGSSTALLVTQSLKQPEMYGYEGSQLDCIQLAIFLD